MHGKEKKKLFSYIQCEDLILFHNEFLYSQKNWND